MDSNLGKGIIEGNPEGLKQWLEMEGIPIEKFEFSGQNQSVSCPEKGVHTPHMMAQDRTFCMGKPGIIGEEELCITVLGRYLCYGNAIGFSFRMPRNASPKSEDLLVRASARQG